MLLLNALVLGNLCKYHHKSQMNKNQIIRTTLRHYRSSFSKFDVVGCKSYHLRLTICLYSPLENENWAINRLIVKWANKNLGFSWALWLQNTVFSAILRP